MLLWIQTIGLIISAIYFFRMFIVHDYPITFPTNLFVGINITRHYGETCLLYPNKQDGQQYTFHYLYGDLLFILSCIVTAANMYFFIRSAISIAMHYRNAAATKIPVFSKTEMLIYIPVFITSMILIIYTIVLSTEYSLSMNSSTFWVYAIIQEIIEKRDGHGANVCPHISILCPSTVDGRIYRFLCDFYYQDMKMVHFDINTIKDVSILMEEYTFYFMNYVMIDMIVLPILILIILVWQTALFIDNKIKFRPRYYYNPFTNPAFVPIVL